MEYYKKFGNQAKVANKEAIHKETPILEMVYEILTSGDAMQAKHLELFIRHQYRTFREANKRGIPGMETRSHSK